MKKSFLTLMILVVLSTGTISADNGFRDLVWGQNVQSVGAYRSEFELSSFLGTENNKQMYRASLRSDEEKTLMGVPIQNYHFHFWNNQLYQIEVHFISTSQPQTEYNYSMLKDKIETRYNRKMIPYCDDEYDLILEDEYIMLRKYGDNITLSLASANLIQKVRLDDERIKKNQANQGW